MFHKDTLRLIKNTFNRFFSLLMIVMIGVAFMMGLLSTRPIMETSVDEYDDRDLLQDFQLYSAYGFDDNDIHELRKQEFTAKVFPSKMADVYSINENNNIAVTRVEEISRAMNLFELVEGRLPETETELVIASTTMNFDEYRLGGKLELYLEDEDLSERLKNTEFTIVGIVKSPSYMAKTLGTSTLKNLELDIAVYIPNTNFLSDYYTTVYFTTPEGYTYDSFGDDYGEYISSVKTDVEVFARRQQDTLKTKLLDEYREKIAEGEKELEEQKAEGQAKLDRAKAQLDEAKIQIVASETQLQSLNTALATANARLSALQTQYDTKTAETKRKIDEIEKGDPQGRTFDVILAEVSADYATYRALEALKEEEQISQFRESIDQLKAQNAEYQSRLDNELYPKRDELNAKIADESIPAEEREALTAELAEVESEIRTAEEQIRVNELLIENLEQMEQESIGQNAEERMKEINQKYGGSVESVYLSYTALEEDRLRMEAVLVEIRLANEVIDRFNAEIAGANAQIEEGKKKYRAGETEYYDGLVRFNAEIEKAEAEIRKAYQDLEELPAAEWIVLDRDSHYSSYMYLNNAKQMGAIGTYLPLLFYLVAALVCVTTMTRLVDEQRGQIGIFRAMGFSRKEIIGKYVVYTVAASLVGSAAGIVIGMMIFPTVIYKTWRLMYDLPDMITLFPIGNLVISVLAFTALMAFVTILVVRKSLSEAPSQLMRPKAPKNARKTFVEHITPIWKRLSFTSKITVRNILRYKARFFMTVIGVAGCTGLLVVGWGIKDSIKDVVAIQFGEIYNYNYTVSLENDFKLEDTMAILEGDLSNEIVTPVMSYSSKVYLEKNEKVLTVCVTDARKGNDVFHLRALDYETPVKINNSGVILSEKFARNNKIQAGDYITIESVNGIKADVKVNEICEMYFQHFIYMSNDYYEAIFREPVHPNSILVKSNDGEALTASLEEAEGVMSVVDLSNLTTQFNIMIEALDYIILVIIFTAGALAFVVLVNLTQVNISERIREIATLKVLGFRSHEINSYIFKEIFLLSVIGGIAGLPLGIAEHRFIMGVINMEMIKFGTNIKPMTFVYAYSITLVFTVIVLLFTRKTLRKIEMIESLKSVE